MCLDGSVVYKGPFFWLAAQHVPCNNFQPSMTYCINMIILEKYLKGNYQTKNRIYAIQYSSKYLFVRDVLQEESDHSLYSGHEWVKTLDKNKWIDIRG